MERLAGGEVVEDDTWKKGWENQLNAHSQDELDAEIAHLLESITEVKSLLDRKEKLAIVGNDHYDSQYDVIQAMASHLSYHLGELVLLRRIFGNWPPPTGGYVW